ncbi:MAG TPA: hypothetical protein VGP72_14245 [Planctomycetota bacterium]|jgi:hypothetical protein
MPRQDLLHISVEDLVTFTNRGTVNRASREIDAGEPACELSEAGDGTIDAKWSDGVTCVLPGAKTAREGRCTCPSVTMCRHLVRTILKYQRSAANSAATPVAPQEPWDPGEITDEALRQQVPKAMLARAQKQFQDGVLLELVRGVKPTALLHGLSINVRFMVKGDLRYAHVDCAPQMAPQIAALVVWAFRLLPKEKRAGMVSSGSGKQPIPEATLSAVEKTVDEWLEHGLSAAPEHFAANLSRLSSECVREGLFWPADIVDALAEQFQRYSARDALFMPELVVELLGELLIRSDAIRSATPAVPQALVRGTRDDRPLELGQGRYVGLGCGVHTLKKGAIINVFMQDADSGMVVAVTREFADPADPKHKPLDFNRLAQTSVVQSTPLQALGQGVLLTAGGKRTPARRLITARTRCAVNPQAFSWEQLKEPVRVDSFDELRERLAAMPPSALRARRVADNFYVLKVASVKDGRFDPPRQITLATLLDGDGQSVTLQHPYSLRGRGGAEALLDVLAKAPESIRFVAGSVRLTTDGLTICPTAVVREANGVRSIVQPLVDGFSGKAVMAGTTQIAPAEADPVASTLRETQDALSDLLVLGLRRADAPLTRRMIDLSQRTGASGFRRLAERLKRLSAELERKSHAARWDGQAACEACKELLVLVRMGEELI